jgi:hypothetical protein
LFFSDVSVPIVGDKALCESLVPENLLICRLAEKYLQESLCHEISIKFDVK